VWIAWRTFLQEDHDLIQEFPELLVLFGGVDKTPSVHGDPKRGWDVPESITRGVGHCTSNARAMLQCQSLSQMLPQRAVVFAALAFGR
jgi:hypothetical protein